MKKKTVVVIDDDDAIRDILTVVLEDSGYNVIQLDDQLKHSYCLAIPNLFVVDISLGNPDHEGFLQSMKRNSHTASIPVILTSTGLDLEEKAADWKAQACISKPFDLDDLLQKVAILLN